MYTRHEISLDEHSEWWAKTQCRKDQLYQMYEFSGSPQGIVAFTGIDPTNSNATWAFYANPNAPTGTGLRMEFLALECAFTDLGLHKLSCEVFAFNAAVIKLHRKFGFREEGIFRDHHMVDGRFEDIYRLAIFESEWAAQKSKMAEKITSYSSRLK